MGDIVIFFRTNLWISSGGLLGPYYAPWHDIWYIGRVVAVADVARIALKASTKALKGYGGFQVEPAHDPHMPISLAT